MPVDFVADGLICGLTGNVEKGPAVTDLLFGGRPLGSFTLAPLPPMDQAAETVGPWRFLGRADPGCAD